MSGGKDGALWVWAVPIGADLAHAADGLTCVGALTGQGASVASVAANTSGRRCLGGGWDGSLRVWDLPDVTEALPSATGKGGKRAPPSDVARQSLPGTAPAAELAGHTDCVAAAAWPAPNTAVTGGWDHSVRLWDVTRGEAVCTHHGSKAVYAAAPQPGGGTLVAFGGADNALRLWDPRCVACENNVCFCLCLTSALMQGARWRSGGSAGADEPSALGIWGCVAAWQRAPAGDPLPRQDGQVVGRAFGYPVAQRGGCHGQAACCDVAGRKQACGGWRRQSIAHFFFEPGRVGVTHITRFLPN